MQIHFLNKNKLNKSKSNSIFSILLYSILFTACTPEQKQEKFVGSFRFKQKYEPIIDTLISQMTLDEKVGLLHGTGKFVSGGVKRLGIEEFHYTDGPNGVREELERHSWKPIELGNDSAMFFPTGSALAATWNTDLAIEYGIGLGLETRARGKDMILGPAVNIMRTPLCGRNFEYFTEDPYLNSRIAVGYVNGVQSVDVAACVKHFAANNQEYERGRINVEISDRALHEIYLPVYKAVINEANAMGMMGAYNKFRGEYLCQNDYLNNQILKKEFDFKGIIVSDWGATHNTVKAALGGLDIEMGTKTTDLDYNQNYMGFPLRDSVLTGVVPIEVINDKVKRILRVNLNLKKMDEGRCIGEFGTPKIKNIARNVASESIVLLKNHNNLLPLNRQKLKSIAVIGFNSNKTHAKGGFTAGVKTKYEITPIEGLTNKLNGQIEINYAMGYIQRFETENNWRTAEINTADTLLIEEAVAVARKSDVAIIFAGNTREVESETKDRKSLILPFGQDELIKAVTAVNRNTIVVIVAGAATNLNLTKERANTILYSWFNGSEAGNAIADVLFGDINPSGKLPFTIPVNLNDVGVHALNAYPGEDLKVEYKEGIFVGYRWFDYNNIEPAYAFGHGLSYTSFEYSDLKIEKKIDNKKERLFISIKVKNTGNFNGKEVVQCYVKHNKSSVIKPIKELKAFKKIDIAAGSFRKVNLSIDVNDLAYYDESLKNWVLEPGQYTFMLGSSSKDIRAEKIFEIY